MKNLILLLILVAFSSQKATATTHEIDIVTSKDWSGAEDLAITGLGLLAGLASHELGHIATIEYTGGDFIDFRAPYDRLGIPTLWMEGDRFQLGTAAMMGNNTSTILASAILNKKIKKTSFTKGLLWFSLANPIGYSLSINKHAIDFETASDNLGVDIDVLKTINMIQAINIATKASTDGATDLYDESTLRVGLADKYIRVSNAGTLYTNQQYWKDGNYSHSVNMGVGVRLDEYKFGLGVNTKKNYDDIKEIKYLEVGKNYAMLSGNLGLTARLSESSTAEVEYTKDMLYINHNTDNKVSNLGLKVKF